MLLEVLLPCLIILGTGITVLSILKYILKITISASETLIFSLILGTGLLVIPWAYMGLQYNVKFFQFWPIVFSFIGTIGLVFFSFKYFKSLFMNFDRLVDKIKIFSTNNSDKNYFKRTLILLILIAFVLLDLTLYQLFLPIRGYDAIWLYIPDALWYYQVGFIPPYDLINFRPTVKEPAQTLLFSYTMFIEGNFYIQLIPILFLFVWGLVVYIWVKQLSKDPNKALFASLLFFISPFTYWLINFWPYYQDLYEGFFYSVTLYCLFRASYTDLNKRGQLFYVLFGAIAFALSLLAKLNGWTLIVLILFLIPWKNKLRIIPTLVVIPISVMLYSIATGDVYLGVGIFIIICTIFMITLIWLYNPPNYSKISLNLLIIPIGIFLGSYWLTETISRFPSEGTDIIEQYFGFITRISYSFPAKALSDPSYQFEGAQSADFWGVILFLLVGNIFVLLWALPKLRALIDKDSRFFSLWSIFYFIIWVTYYGSISIRYLTPILVPVIILVTNGVYKIVKDITKQENNVPLWLLLVIAFFSLFSYYFPLPPELISQLITKSGLNVYIVRTSFLQSAHYYYSNALLFVVLVILVSFVIYKIFVYYNLRITNKVSNLHLSRKLSLIFYGILIFGIIFVPIAAPTIILINNNGNITNLQENWVYEDRPAYKDIVNELRLLNDPLSSILVVSMPGLGWQIDQPVLDLNNAIGFSPLFSKNVSAGLSFLKTPASVQSDLSVPSFNYIIIPSYGNQDYANYANYVYDLSFLFPILYNTHLYTFLYANSDYRLFKRVYTSSNYQGLIDVKMTDNTGITDSILGQIQNAITFNTLPYIQLSFDFTQLPVNNVNLTWSLTYLKQNSVVGTNNVTMNLQTDKTDFTLANLNLDTIENSTNLSSLYMRSLSFSYSYTYENQYTEVGYNLLMSNSNQPILNYANNQNVWFINYGAGLVFSP